LLEIKHAMRGTLTDLVALPHGVTSLDPSDSAWLGKHLDWSRSHFDDAYHNGDIWLWLTGPTLQLLAETNHAFERWDLVETWMSDLLDHGVLGSMREIQDGLDTKLEDFGGATSQAWSLAEFLRAASESWGGISPQLLNDRIIWRVSWLDQLDWIEMPVFLSSQKWLLRVEKNRAFVRGDGTEVFNHRISLKLESGEWPKGQSRWVLWTPPFHSKFSDYLGPDGFQKAFNP